MPGPPPVSVADTPAYKNKKIFEKLHNLMRSLLMDATPKQNLVYKKNFISWPNFTNKNSLLPLIYGYSNSELALQFRLGLHQLFMIAFNPSFFSVGALRHSFKNPGCLYFSFLPSFMQLYVVWSW